MNVTDKMKTAVKFFTVSLITAAILLWFQRPALTVIKTWKQAAEINYQSYDPYFFHVVEDNWDLGHVPFSINRNYFFYIGKEQTNVTYGHVKHYSFEFNQDLKSYLDKCQVDWTIEGVFFTEPSGHRLFIPKASFIGGR